MTGTGTRRARALAATGARRTRALDAHGHSTGTGTRTGTALDGHGHWTSTTTYIAYEHWTGTIAYRVLSLAGHNHILRTSTRRGWRLGTTGEVPVCCSGTNNPSARALDRTGIDRHGHSARTSQKGQGQSKEMATGNNGQNARGGLSSTTTPSHLARCHLLSCAS